MKKMAGIALALIAVSSHAEESKPLLHRASDELMYQMFKDEDTPMGRAMRKNRRDAENRAIRSAPQVKSARECAKPGNVIDEDVRRCMKGM
ncbi:hypothetical protein [Azotobacter salinestris]|uniref:hypothetical protein n=1 Tax=Azotobacter salinestris TaxID=69964 RepID=UPI0032DE6992